MLVKIINGNKLLAHRKAQEMPAFIVTYLDRKYASNTTRVLRKVFCDYSSLSPNLNQIDENKAPLKVVWSTVNQHISKQHFGLLVD